MLLLELYIADQDISLVYYATEEYLQLVAAATGGTGR
jgi:hypothetical protein